EDLLLEGEAEMGMAAFKRARALDPTLPADSGPRAKEHAARGLVFRAESEVYGAVSIASGKATVDQPKFARVVKLLGQAKGLDPASAPGEPTVAAKTMIAQTLVDRGLFLVRKGMDDRAPAVCSLAE